MKNQTLETNITQNNFIFDFQISNEPIVNINSKTTSLVLAKTYNENINIENNPIVTSEVWIAHNEKDVIKHEKYLNTGISIETENGALIYLFVRENLIKPSDIFEETPPKNLKKLDEVKEEDIELKIIQQKVNDYIDNFDNIEKEWKEKNNREKSEYWKKFDEWQKNIDTLFEKPEKLLFLSDEKLNVDINALKEAASEPIEKFLTYSEIDKKIKVNILKNIDLKPVINNESNKSLWLFDVQFEQIKRSKEIIKIINGLTGLIAGIL